MSIADLRERVGVSTRRLHTPIRRYGFAVLSVAVATTLQFGMSVLGPSRFPFLLFPPTIVLVAMWAGFWPGIVATALSATSGGFFFLEPRNSFVIHTPDVLVGPAVFACVGVFLTFLTCSGRRAQQALRGSEQELRRREADYRQFVAQSSEGIFREDMDRPVSIDLPEDELVHHLLCDSYLSECNDAIAKMYGFTTGRELAGKRLTETLDPNDPRNLELTREFVRAGFRVLERESHETDVHGNPKVFRNSMIGIVEDGKLVRTWGIQRDVTEQVELEQARRQAEKDLRRSEEYYRILVEQASDGIFIADDEGKYLEVNSAGAEMLGYTRDEIMQGNIADIVDGDEIPRIAQELALLLGGETIRSEWKFRRKDGSLFPGEVCGGNDCQTDACRAFSAT